MKKLFVSLFILVITSALFSCEKKEEKIESETQSDTEIEKSSESSEIEDKNVKVAKAVTEQKVKGRKDFSKEDWEYEKCRELNVKTRKLYSRSVNLKGEMPKDKYLIEKIEFDNRGYRTSQTTYRIYERVHIKWKFKFDDNGNQVLVETFNRDDILRMRRNISYDELGDAIQKTEFRAARQETVETDYKYDEEKKLVEISSATKDGLRKIREVNDYENGLVVKTTSYSSDNQVIKEIESDYDEKGNKIYEAIKMANGGIAKTNYKYDENGLIIEIDAPIFKRLYEYDENEDVIVDIMFNRGGGRQHKFINEYYDNGLIKKSTRYDSKDNPTKIAEYEYKYYN